MATKIKTNERPGTRSQARYVRMSASKARLVLNEIRGKQVGEASVLLTYSQRRSADVIQKCLHSAVANAHHNDEIPAEELYVSACYADEGPTLKRFRPRARGRAGRIHKQTCHITVIVSRYSDEELDEMRRRAELRGSSRSSSGDTAAERQRRVARSKDADTNEDVAEEDQVTEDLVAEDQVEADEAVDQAEDVVEDTSTEEAADGTADASGAEESEAAADDASDDEPKETN